MRKATAGYSGSQKVDEETEERYTYDRRGSLSQILAGGTVKNQYLYGALNRMEQAVNQTGSIARYTYNGLGHRVGKQVGNPRGTNQTLPQPFSRESLEAGLNPMEQLKSSSLNPTKQIDYTVDLTRQYHNLLQKTEDHSHTQTYLWDGNAVGMLEQGSEGAESYYLQDDLGSPVRLLYENGEVQESYGYGEFGEELYQNQSLSQPFGFTGYQRDEVAGTYFAQAREYRAEAGRFVNQDLIPGFAEYPFSMNRYSYCFNSPMILVDLDGELPTILIGAGIGALIGGGGSIISDLAKGKKVDWKKAGKNALKGGAAGAIIGTGVGAVGALSSAGASFRAGADAISSIKNKEITISNPNRYLSSAVSGAIIYNSVRIAPRSAALGFMTQGISDVVSGDLSSFESYAGSAMSVSLMARYIKNPTRLKNLLGVVAGASGTQLLEIMGGIREFSMTQIKNEAIEVGVVSILAGKLGNIKKLKAVLGEDEWAALLDGLRRRMKKCEND